MRCIRYGRQKNRKQAYSETSERSNLVLLLPFLLDQQLPVERRGGSRSSVDPEGKRAAGEEAGLGRHERVKRSVSKGAQSTRRSGGVRREEGTIHESEYCVDGPEVSVELLVDEEVEGGEEAGGRAKGKEKSIDRKWE